MPFVRHILILLLLILATKASGSDLFVSPDGNDSNPGTRQQPLASLAGARDAVRKQVAAGGDSDLNVHIRGGTYLLTEPVVFTASDSAPEGRRITYRAAPGERPIFSGGRRIQGFKVRADGSWEMKLPRVADGSWQFEQLFVNGKRATRARTPNEGDYHYFHGVNELVLEAGAPRAKRARQEVRLAPDVFAQLPPASDPDFQDIILTVYHKWDISRKPLVGADPEAHTIHTSGHGMKPWNPWKPGTRYHLENLPSALDTPGEWFLSREGILRYRPRAGEHPDTAEVIAPAVEELLVLKGSPKGPTGDAGNGTHHDRANHGRQLYPPSGRTHLPLGRRHLDRTQCRQSDHPQRDIGLLCRLAR
ncbi:MAG: hypothetical protein CML13_01820 [Puniceicoccaceae bacterium]|nr:hypothetical protein [Puniceicoccaceae bacterium]|tara:strand:- start:1879 stop:2964 length:1086 start_codon:yes stop_codon:yes gene_type:complete